jgi:hyperosmotically inducible periplasmic protein
MRARSFLTAVVVLVVVCGLLYYFYSYHNRNISADMSTVKEYAGDSETTSAVKTALALNKDLSSLDIHVETTNNIVTLTGQVPAADNKRVAGEVALSTKGVTSVTNDLQVGPSPSPTIQPADSGSQGSGDIKAAVLQSIQNSPTLRTEQIKVDVNNGDVKLSGSVHTQAQKTGAETAAGAVANVRNVDSRGLAVANSRH